MSDVCSHQCSDLVTGMTLGACISKAASRLLDILIYINCQSSRCEEAACKRDVYPDPPGEAEAAALGKLIAQIRTEADKS